MKNIRFVVATDNPNENTRVKCCLFLNRKIFTSVLTDCLNFKNISLIPCIGSESSSIKIYSTFSRKVLNVDITDSIQFKVSSLPFRAGITTESIFLMFP